MDVGFVGWWSDVGDADVGVDCMLEAVKLLRCLDGSNWWMVNEFSKWDERDVILFTISSKCTKLQSAFHSSSKTKAKNKKQSK